MTQNELLAAAKFSELSKAQIFTALFDLAGKVEGWPLRFHPGLEGPVLSRQEANTLAALEPVLGSEYLEKLAIKLRDGAEQGAALIAKAQAVLDFILANPGAKAAQLIGIPNGPVNQTELDKVLKLLIETGRIARGFSAGSNPAPVGSLI